MRWSLARDGSRILVLADRNELQIPELAIRSPLDVLEVPMTTSCTLTADRRVKAETKVKSGQGDKGDR